jgi:predicted  nucleic acid-binding Zn-ribbon protein|tara:strand:+ start:651 stop:983 length:333 start_codon:yes stop_codon:yes gene_type:complete
MSIDFSKKEDREGYLNAKLDDLLDGINSSYGQSLLDELMVRLETTIDDFNKEVDDLMDSLKKSSDEKEKLMMKIKANEPDELQDETASSDDTVTEERDLSEWEKRLEGMK